MANSESEVVTRPTWCRWYVVGLATIMSMILYLDRFCWSFASTLIQEDVGITSADADLCLSCFFWAYALAQIPTGWLSDRWGSRMMLTLYIFSWSVFTILIGWSASLIMLVAMQLGLGLGQAGAYPTSASMLSRWMPISTRGIASSIVAFGGRFGGAFAPILTGWLIVAFVPVGTSSLLTSDQLLPKGIGAFCQNIQSSRNQDSPANPEIDAIPETTNTTQKANATVPPAETMAHPELTRRLWTHLEASSGLSVEKIVQREQDWRRKFAAAIDGKAKNAVPDLEFATEDLGQLSEGLNLALKDPTLVTPEIIAPLNLDLEAKRLLKRRDAGQELTLPQTERLNRLVLEKAFPKAIGKIYVKGWRRVYTAYGIAGMFIAVLFFLVVRNRPEEHPACNAAEVSLIHSGRPAPKSTVGQQPPLPWGKILRSSSLWFSSLSQAGTNIGWLFVASKLPEYLEKVHQVEISRRGWLSSWPMFAGIAGLLIGGRLTDWLRVKLGLRWGRSIPMGLTKVGAASAYIGCIFARDPVTAAVLCAAVAFFTDLGIAATWAFVQDAGGRYVGVVLGFGNMWGNIGAAIAPIIYSTSISWTKDLQWSKEGWNTCFAVCATAMIISGIAGILIDATKPIIGDEPETEQPA